MHRNVCEQRIDLIGIPAWSPYYLCTPATARQRWASDTAFHVFHPGTNGHPSPHLCFHYCDLGNAQMSMWCWYLTLIIMNMWWWPQKDQLVLLKCLITSGTSVVVFVSQMKENHVIPIWIMSNKTYCIISVLGIVPMKRPTLQSFRCNPPWECHHGFYDIPAVVTFP